MNLNPQDLEKIADLTPEHYNQRAESIACSLTPRCFMYPAWRCRACYWNCTQP
jgi:hypothetical protein